MKFQPSAHSYGAEEASAEGGSGAGAGGVSPEAAMLAIKGGFFVGSGLTSWGKNKIATAQAEHQAGVAAEQAAIQAEKDAKNAAKTQKIILYTALAGFTVAGGLSVMYVMKKRQPRA